MLARIEVGSDLKKQRRQGSVELIYCGAQGVPALSQNLSKSFSAGWSKEFTEHLRTIHFALVSVAIGLILLSFSTKNYDSVVAAREMDQIVQLRSLWKPRWIASKGTKKFLPTFLEISSTQNTGQTDLSKLGIKPGEVFTGTIQKGVQLNQGIIFPDWAWPIPLTLGEKTVLYGSHDKTVVELSIEKNWGYRKTASGWSPEAFPSTLAEFRRWWDTMETQPYQAVFPTAVLPEKMQTNSGAKAEPPAKKKKTKQQEPKKISWVISDEHKNRPTERRALDLIVGNNEMQYVASTSLGPIRLNIDEFVFTEVTQQMLASHFGNWTLLKEPKRDSFNSSFPDLANAAHEFEALSLEKIDTILSDEAAKGSEVFEAFGMKFPADQITVWGIVILLGVQTYLCLYLRQLDGLRPSEEARAVPWIGLDTSWQARCLVTTSMFLPSGALGMLTWRSVTARPIHSSFWTDAKFLVLAGAIAVSLFLSVYSLKYLPKEQEMLLSDASSASEELVPADD